MLRKGPAGQMVALQPVAFRFPFFLVFALHKTACRFQNGLSRKPFLHRKRRAVLERRFVKTAFCRNTLFKFTAHDLHDGCVL